MKKNVLLIIIALALIIGDFLLYQDRNILFKKTDNEKKIPAKEKDLNAFGMVYTKDNNVLNIKIANKFYKITIPEQIDIQSINIGSNLQITYKGSLDNTNDIEIKEIKKVSDTDSILKAWQDEGIFKDYYAKALEKLNSLSLEEKIGQLLLVRTPEENKEGAIENYNLGGYILFGRDTKGQSKENLLSTITSFQQVAKIPMLIATDEEGGTVVRISNNPSLRDEKFLSPREIFNESGYEGIENVTKEMNELLPSLGINLNLAPVADISTNPDDFMYARSFGQDAQATAKYIETVINASKGSKLSYVLKHFPGYGNNKDTHTDFSIDERSLESFKNNDLIPFAQGVQSGAEAIMVSHNIISAVDSNNPASLSLEVHKIARNDLSFSGILMTDDLDMDAIKVHTEGSPVIKALLADNDMLILSDYDRAFSDIKEALNEGTITEEYLNYHVFKVLAWKYYKGLL